VAYRRDEFDAAVWEVVSRIRPGSVMSYGAVARAAGYPRHARMVGRALGRSPQPLPWHRVVRADLTLAFAPGTTSHARQKARLEREGVVVKGADVVPAEGPQETDLDRLLWGPPVDGVASGKVRRR
jgi:methylated-DNA-protein-cysteine methyltransferase-like protein